MAGLSRTCPRCRSTLVTKYFRAQQRKMYLPHGHVNPVEWRYWCPRCQRYVR